MNLIFCLVGVDDLFVLVELENCCFDYDCLFCCNFQWMFICVYVSLMVVEGDGGVFGYVLVLFYEGILLVCFYFIVIDLCVCGIGFGQKLLEVVEQVVWDNDCVYMCLEVCLDNCGVIVFYECNGYCFFVIVCDYYEDYSEVLCFEKCICNFGYDQCCYVFFYWQIIDFICGLVCLLMVMGVL